jgi:hypothetical protein
MKTTNIPVTSNQTTRPIQLVEAVADYQEPLIISVYGAPGTGKSRLLGTAPGVGLLATENKARQTVIKTAAEFGRTVVMPDVSLNRTANPMLLASLPQTCIVLGDAVHKNWTAGAIQDEMQKIAKTITLTSPPPTCCQRHYFRWAVNRTKETGYRMLEDDRIKTIGVDTFGAFVDDVSYANYGITGVIDPKEFGFAPREDMIKEIREWLNNMSTKNLVLTHHSKEVWKDGKPTNKTQPDGKFSKIGHYTSVACEMIVTDQEFGAGRYVLKTKDCQANASIIGLELLADEEITFQNLAMQVYPESDPDFWA